MTFKEYNIIGQEMIYSVYTFPFKPLAFGEIFLNENKFKALLPHLRTIFSIGTEKPSINTFQSNNNSKGYLSFGRMQFDGKNDTTWLNKYYSTEDWRHFHTDFWIPQKTKAIKNFVFPEIVVCIYGNGKAGTHPNGENFYSNNFSIIIKNELLKGEALNVVTSAIQEIKQQLYDCYYFHFKAPWLKMDETNVLPNGETAFVMRYQLADVDGAFLSLKCIDYFTDFHWKNIYCDETEIIEKEQLTRSFMPEGLDNKG